VTCLREALIARPAEATKLKADRRSMTGRLEDAILTEATVVGSVKSQLRLF
jgi:hypothetical protein